MQVYCYTHPQVTYNTTIWSWRHNFVNMDETQPMKGLGSNIFLHVSMRPVETTNLRVIAEFQSHYQQPPFLDDYVDSRQHPVTWQVCTAVTTLFYFFTSQHSLLNEMNIPRQFGSKIFLCQWLIITCFFLSCIVGTQSNHFFFSQLNLAISLFKLNNFWPVRNVLRFLNYSVVFGSFGIAIMSLYNRDSWNES